MLNPIASIERIKDDCGCTQAPAVDGDGVATTTQWRSSEGEAGSTKTSFE